jgi:hypothetical protein
MSGPDERDNPYQAPRASVERTAPGGRRLWQVYFWMTAVSTGSALFFLATLGSFQLVDLLDFAFVSVGLAGLFGYACRHPIGSPRLWKLWFPFQIAWDTSVELIFAPLGLAHVIGSAAETPSTLETALGYLFLAPFYIALYRYGFRSAELWPRATTERA